MSSYDPRSSGCTPFEEELINAMNDFARSTDSPAFDTVGMVHRTRRRRATLVAAFSAVLIAAGGGSALASISGSTSQTTPAATAVDHAKATFLLGGVTKEPIAVDLTGQDLATAKGQFEKAQLKLGTIVKVVSPGCKPTSVVELTPHSPKIVVKGDTVNVKLCAG
ncbi:PASTA domain-containing protein [Streptomyces sp. MBT53]|uniref:PASTA domain-containing protein n=1 Tax=Streptomyces sp. MBT53 TaxID=1488384 RepID=UPI0019115CE8|nr:PASTA domain-containing protein [Streptomyces sp. MBT53]MBK6011666.1 PASTA domain-containing protein [Streptomyces sp. MBT53]